MRLIPIALALFYRTPAPRVLEVWVQKRMDDGIYHGALEFPGGGIEAGETPIEGAVREVEEEVGIKICASMGKLMGTYPTYLEDKVILLNVFLFPDHIELEGKGQWLRVEKDHLSSLYKGVIPPANHEIIDDLYLSLYK